MKSTRCDKERELHGVERLSLLAQGESLLSKDSWGDSYDLIISDCFRIMG